ncbi:MAG TPA: ribonuclease Z [Cyclobacteriaceae bacterium]|nr:ribonuclease Z [Cyclobacteriaceae bacterium]
MGFSVTILGTNAAIPCHGRNQTSQVVALDNSYFLVDCGEGTQIQLRKFKIRFSKIDNIFISHLHGDHYLGLMGLILSFQLARRERRLTVFGPRGLDEIITVQLRHSNLKLNFPVDFVQTRTDGKNFLLEDKQLKVYSFPLKHRVPCTGFTFEEKPRLRNLVKEKVQQSKLSIEAINALREGKDFLDEQGRVKYPVDEYTHPPAPLRKYAYCSDTVFDETIIPYIQESNLLYHEATFMNIHQTRASETGHSTAAQAAILARSSGARQLLLGHFSSRYTDLGPLLGEAREVFPESFLSEEGKTFWIE